MEPFTSRTRQVGKPYTFLKVILAGFIAYLLLSILVGIVIADFSLKLHRLPLLYRQAIVTVVRTDFHAELQESVYQGG